MKYLLRISVFLRPYLWQVSASLVLLLTLTVINLIVPRVIQSVIDQGLLGGRRETLLRAALILFGLGLASALLNLLHRYTSEWIATSVGYDLRNRLYDHIQRLPFTYHDHVQSGQLISRCIEDVRSIEKFSGSSIAELVRFVFLVVGVLIVMISVDLRLTLLSLLPLIPLILMTTSFGTKIGALFLSVDMAVGEVSNHLQENVTGIQVVRAFAREQHEIQRFARANRKVFNTWVKVIDEWARIMPTTNWLITLGTILVLWFGGQMVLADKLTIGAIVAFNAYVLMLAEPAQALTGLVNAGGEAAAGARRVLEVLDVQPQIHTMPGAIRLEALQGAVEFRAVSLQYQDSPSASLTDINLSIPPNSLVALIGPTGSGKTSFVNLLPRFYDVTGGVLLVDGHDVRQLDLDCLRRQVGVVLQTSLLFSDSIHNNIAYGKPDATLQQVMVAAQAAQAHEFIQGFPHGYKTIVGERGVTLSGGQRQRIAIARALLMDPRILILDDSLSSVDTQTEKLIQSALDTLMQGRTTFVIAHRLSTVRRADLILVLDSGRIVQQGTHQTLLTQGGLYREIYNLQLVGHATDFQELDSQPTPAPASLQSASQDVDFAPPTS